MLINFFFNLASTQYKIIKFIKINYLQQIPQVQVHSFKKSNHKI